MSTRREGERLRNIPQYTDFRALERDLRAAASSARAGPAVRRRPTHAAGEIESTRAQPAQPADDDDAPFGMLVAITGAARSDTLVPCVHAKRPDGRTPERAIYVDAVTDQYLARQAVRSGEWIRDAVVVAAMAKEAPTWRIEDPAGCGVNMHRATSIAQASDAARAADWHLSLVHDEFESASGAGSGSSLQSRIIANALDVNAGLNVLGLRHRERVLAPGARLTAVGEAFIAPPGGPVGVDGSDGAGEIRLRRPRRPPRKKFGTSRMTTRGGGGAGDDKSAPGDEKSAPGDGDGDGDGPERPHAPARMNPNVFTVTQKPFDAYVDGFGSWGAINAVVGACFFGVGAALVVAKMWRARLTRWREARFLRRMKEAEEARMKAEGEGNEGGDTAGDGGDTAGGDTKVSLGETCVVCLYARSEVVYKECGHLVCCGVCAGRMDRCPLCRRRSAHMRVYRAGL